MKISEFRGETQWLSNFYYIDIVYEGITYPSNEHAYQAMKSDNIKVRKIFSKLKKCGEAKTLGSQIKLRDNWDNIKLKIMEDVCRLKFNREPLKTLLLHTRDVELIEGNHWNDTFWGICNGQGENHLGKILMKIRTELRQK